MRIGFLGTGHIAAPMARALARDGHEIVVSHRNEKVSTVLARDTANVRRAENQSVIDETDIVFLCIRPHLAEKVIAPLTFREGQQIVSVMAGVPAAALADWCAPATDISITIPLGFVEAGGCPLAVYPRAAPLEALFGARNPIFPVSSEAALNSHFAICALVPGLLAMLETGADWLAKETGDPNGAERYTTQIMAGFLNAMAQGAGRLKAEKDALATEGTISLMMVEALEDGATGKARAAMEAIGRRLDPKT